MTSGSPCVVAVVVGSGDDGDRVVVVFEEVVALGVVDILRILEKPVDAVK